MSDIDFDELDKAVNSLMQPKSGAEQSSQSPTESSQLSQSSTHQAEAIDATSDAPDLGVNPPAATATPSESTNNARPSLATKRRGQFMDVMHASADMKSKPAARATAPRQGVTLQPMNTSAQSSESEAANQSPATTLGAEVSVAAQPSLQSSSELGSASEIEPDTTAVAATEAPVSEPASSSADGWPDPIDMLDESNSVPDTQSDDTEDQAPASDYTDVANSPFLPDAKVEKRPLGVTADDTSADGQSEENTPVTTTEVDQIANEQSDSNLPAELHESLMTLEGSETSSQQTQTSDEVSALDQASSQSPDDTADQPPAASVVESGQSATQSTDMTTPAPEPLASPTKVTQQPPVSVTPASPTPAAISTSLPPRTPAAVEEEGDDDTTTSIFNTDDQSLRHQPKHSSGWYTIMVFAGMVIVGVLGAVVFYLMTNRGV